MGAIDHLARLPQHVIRPGLSRITAACAALGDPQGAFPAILVAGTNGKGSTCAYLASALACAGARVGLYTSPHLVDFSERIAIAGEPIAATQLEASFAELVRAFPEGLDPDRAEALTYFEAATALAFVAFARAGVGVAVLEVGLGGRLDATNVPGTRLVATAVTRVALDHEEWLGGTLAAIAAEKGAIARRGVPLVLAPQEPEAHEVLVRCADRSGAPRFEARPVVDGRHEGPAWTLDGVRPGLLGAHQLENAGVALTVLQVAPELAVPPQAAALGIARASWPGRLERIAGEPPVVLDGAHNADGARALARSFRELWPGLRAQVVIGVLEEKDRAAMLEAIAPIAAGFFTCAPASPRAVPAAELAREIAARGLHASPEPSTASAVGAARRAAGERGIVLVCGSLYVVGEARALLAPDG